MQELYVGKVEVVAIDPVESMASVDNPKLVGVTKQVRVKLKDVIDNL